MASISNVACWLYILLFVYAATSKLMDFENFKIQIGQSPLISAFAGYIIWIIPIGELLIAAALIFPKTKVPALYAAYSLMVLFTAYIVIILNYSSSIPCSCGGILEKLGWKEHLWFNIGFVALAIVGLFTSLKIQSPYHEKHKLTFWLLLLASLSIGLMISLNLLSEQRTAYHNNFTRRFPAYTQEHKVLDLAYDSYYFAGFGNDTLYLGNLTGPLGITAVDAELRPHKHLITLDKPEQPWQDLGRYTDYRYPPQNNRYGPGNCLGCH